jgi:ABC-type bacteriocin/lantibiotic exporter with double-glycine peptidase domain
MFGRMVTTIMFRTIVVGAILVLPAVCGTLLAADLPGVWLDVPFVRQEKDGCGAASIAMVMQYWQYQLGAAVSQDSDPIQIRHVLYSAKIHGIYASDMERYFREKGFRTFTIRGEWKDLKQHLDKGRPLIVALKPAAGAPLHYVVVTGLDQEQGIVMVNDPAQRKLLKQDRSAFEQEWSAAEKWTLLAMPQTQSR